MVNKHITSIDGIGYKENFGKSFMEADRGETGKSFSETIEITKGIQKMYSIFSSIHICPDQDTEKVLAEKWIGITIIGQVLNSLLIRPTKESFLITL